MKSIMEAFPVSTEEYNKLESEFGNLCHYAAWQLYKKNNRNNLTDDQEDIVQELRIAIIRAGSYYKRQTFIESSFESLQPYLNDPFLKKVYEELLSLWHRRTRHGANKQKFGYFQEELLKMLVNRYVPVANRPSSLMPLNIDRKFTTYCKHIAWNAQKLMGKKITREKSWRTNLVSISEFDYLGAENN